MEERNREQHCAIRFCVRLNENAEDTYEKLKKVYGEHTLSKAEVFKLHKTFLDGLKSVEGGPHSARPCTSKIDKNMTKIKSLVEPDGSLIVGTIARKRRAAADLGVSRNSILTILRERQWHPYKLRQHQLHGHGFEQRVSLSRRLVVPSLLQDNEASRDDLDLPLMPEVTVKQEKEEAETEAEAVPMDTAFVAVKVEPEMHETGMEDLEIKNEKVIKEECDPLSNEDRHI